MNTEKIVHVAVAVIQRLNPDTQSPEILIAKRPDHLHQGGLWEFPGGKVEKGESILAALDRELFEELGIRLQHSSDEQNLQQNTQPKTKNITQYPLIKIRHSYPDKTVLLDVWKVLGFQGAAHGKEGQAVRWVALSQLKNFTFPQANLPILAACLLPERYFITPAYSSLSEAESGLQAALRSGAELIYFRQPQLDQQSYAAWVNRICSRNPTMRNVLMLQRLPDADMQRCAGVHLSFRTARALESRPVEQDQWFAVSCHDASEMAEAVRLQADFATVSPVLPTSSHPDAPGMGWDVFQRLVQDAVLPVYGLGGLGDEHLPLLRESGAQGLAGISFWQA